MFARNIKGTANSFDHDKNISQIDFALMCFDWNCNQCSLKSEFLFNILLSIYLRTFYVHIEMFQSLSLQIQLVYKTNQNKSSMLQAWPEYKQIHIFIYSIWVLLLKIEWLLATIEKKAKETHWK